MSITSRSFGRMSGGETATLFEMTNARGTRVRVTDAGAIWQGADVPDREGALGDVVLGFDDVSGYGERCGSMGMVIGRFANRIGGARFRLGGREYTVYANDGENALHGGRVNYGMRLWHAEAIMRACEDEIRFTLDSPDMDEGFPGALRVTVSYRLARDDDRLTIAYRAVTDKMTILNLTNHAYFNLAGQGAETVLDHTLQVDADCVTEVAPGLIPTGRLLPVGGTVFDLRAPRLLSDVIARGESDAQFRMGEGIDHNFCLGRDREMKRAATLYCEKSGREMRVDTDQPGIQVYSANHLDLAGKGGARYAPRSGVCLETQHYPDSVHHPHFPSVVLRPGETFLSDTVFTFTTR